MKIVVPLIAILAIVPSLAELVGDHVCSGVKNVTVTQRETYTEPVIVKTFTWCLQIPPRCPTTRTELRQRYRVKSETNSVPYSECCEGYQPEFRFREIPDDWNVKNMKREWMCVPFCENCTAGRCVSPGECRCEAGYRGENCTEKCPEGTWGELCAGRCECEGEASCDPANGLCRCLPGWTGLGCTQRCPSDKWGSNCVNSCSCAGQFCDSVNGECLDDLIIPVENYPSAREDTEIPVEFFVPPHVTEINPEVAEVADPATTEVAPVSRSHEEESRKKDENQTTTFRPVVVLVSVPERTTYNASLKISMKDTLAERTNEKEDTPKIDYVKTIRKIDDFAPASIPLDIALIVIASIVCLALTSVAVITIMHMRSRLFERIRLSIYDDGKTKDREQRRDDVETPKTPNVPVMALPQTPVIVNPIFEATCPPSAVFTLDRLEPATNTYANGTATIGLRISSANLRDLLEGHYDKPTGTLVRLHTTLDVNNEHIYDEIPYHPDKLA